MSLVQLGRQLFAGNCSSCHGSDGRGVRTPQGGVGNVRGQGPSLRGVGALAADFYLRTGRMPLENPHQQPWRQRTPFSDREVRALVRFVASLGPGPPIPHPDTKHVNLASGFRMFTDHCAGCHQVAGEGGLVTGARVPPLDQATATQIAQAVRIGPFVIPRFSKRQISDRDLNAIVAYVLTTQHPHDRGGWGIDHLGPFPEGMVTWFLAALMLIAVCVIIGKRLRSS